MISTAILLAGASAVVYIFSVNGIVTSHAQPERASTAAFPATIPLPAGVAWADIVISANGQHLAFAARDTGGTTQVWLDGKVYATHPATETIYRPSYVIGCMPMPVNSLTLSADGARIGYLLDVKEPADPNVVDRTSPLRRIVVIDGKRSGEYLDATPPVFNADGTQVAYAAHEKGIGWRIWRNGVPGRSFENIALGFGARVAAKPAPAWMRNDSGFSADGRHFCYTGYRKDGWYAVVDEKEYGPYPRIQGLTFAGEGSGPHLFGFAAENPDGTMALVVDGKVEQGYAQIIGPVYSANGAHISFAAKRSKDTAYFIKGVGDKRFVVDGDIRTPPVLNADGTHVAYLVYGSKDASSVFFDGARVYSPTAGASPLGTNYISSFTFTPDGESVVFYGGRGLFVRGKVVADYPRAYWRYAFTPDGTLAYVRYTDDGKQRVVVGDRAYPPVDGTVSGLTISPGGDVLYAAHQWTPDGTRTGKSRVNIYVNEALHGSYEIMLPFPYDIQPRFFVDTPDRVHYFAIRDGKIHRVEVAL